jgi:hypothetical protein
MQETKAQHERIFAKRQKNAFKLMNLAEGG